MAERPGRGPKPSWAFCSASRCAASLRLIAPTRTPRSARADEQRPQRAAGHGRRCARHARRSSAASSRCRAASGSVRGRRRRRAGVARDRRRVEDVEDHVAAEVRLGQHRARAALQHRRAWQVARAPGAARRACGPAARCCRRRRACARAPSACGDRPARRPARRGRSSTRSFEARLVERHPPGHDPLVGRQPVQTRALGRVGVSGAGHGYRAAARARTASSESSSRERMPLERAWRSTDPAPRGRSSTPRSDVLSRLTCHNGQRCSPDLAWSGQMTIESTQDNSCAVQG